MDTTTLRFMAPDSFSAVLGCQGRAFKAELKAELKAEKVPETKEENITVDYPATSDDYVKRLKFVLGGDIVKRNAAGTQVALPRFWLKQLKEKAIDELSRELKAPQSVFRV